jgi:hypothetical protein
VFSKITANVLSIGEGRAFEKRQFKYCTKADRSTNVQLLPLALLLPIPCYLPLFLSVKRFS